MLGIGWMEAFFILVIALVVLGPEKMVDTARWLGKTIREFRKTTDEVTRSLSLEEPPPRPYQRRADETPPASPEGSYPKGQEAAADREAGPDMSRPKGRTADTDRTDRTTD